MEPRDKLARFEQVILPHLDAAYNLARWLARNDQDAEDVVQEAYLRAFRFFEGFHGGDGRAWLLAIVRNVYYSLVGRSPAPELTTVFDEEMHSLPSDDFNPEKRALRRAESRQLQEAIEELPREAREVLVLRELEDLSYKEIAEIVEVPLGTVMSRLARARAALKTRLEHRPASPANEER